MSRKLLNIGTFIEFSTLEIHKDIDEFIFVDCGPRFNIEEMKYDKSVDPTKNDSYEQYLHDIKTIPTYYGYKLISDERSILTFKNYISYKCINSEGPVYSFEIKPVNKTIKYYYNMYLPDEITDEFIQDISNVRYLMISGLTPDKMIYNYLNLNDIIIILTNKDVYHKERIEEDFKPINNNKVLYIEFSDEIKLSIPLVLIDDPIYNDCYNESNNINVNKTTLFNSINEFGKHILEEINILKRKYADDPELKINL